LRIATCLKKSNRGSDHGHAGRYVGHYAGLCADAGAALELQMPRDSGLTAACTKSSSLVEPAIPT